jgi:hypothetical protein
MPGKRACPVRREAIRKRTRPARVPRRMVDPAGNHLREHGHAATTDAALTTAFADLRGAQLTTKAACALIGRPRASHTGSAPDRCTAPKKHDWCPTTVRP